MQVIIKKPDGGRGIVECEGEDSVASLFSKVKFLVPSLHPLSISLSTLDGQEVKRKEGRTIAEEHIHHESTLTISRIPSRGEEVNPFPDSIIKLNVGGIITQTTFNTLVNKKTEHSLLYSLFVDAAAVADGAGM